MTRPWGWGWRRARLGRDTSPESAEAQFGDLLEEYAAVRARSGRLRAEWWLLQEMSSLHTAYDDERHGVAAQADRRLPRLGGQFRYALRSLRRSPWYAVTTISVIAIAVALAASVFSIVDGALFKPLPYGDANRVFGVSLGYSRLAEDIAGFGITSEADVAEWRDAVPEAPLAAFNEVLPSIGSHDAVEGKAVDATFFDVVGIRPIIGGFSAEDYRARQKVAPAIVSYKFWQKRLDGRADAIGHVFVNDGGSGIRVVGVLPEGFIFPNSDSVERAPEFLVPRIAGTPLSHGLSYYVVARVPTGVSLSSVSDRLNAVVARQFAARPKRTLPPGTPARRRITSDGYDRLRLTPIREAMTANYRPGALGMLAAALTLVALACLNVAGLTVARLRDREYDLTIRRALGARLSDLVALLAAEHAAIVAAGAFLGLISAHFLAVEATPYLHSVMVVMKAPSVDLRVAIFTALVSFAVVLVITAMSARAIAVSNLRARISQMSGATRRERRRALIVAVEMGLGVVLAVGGSLVMSSLVRAWAQDPGFDTEHAALVWVGAGQGRSAAELEDLVTGIAHLPGVTAVGGLNHAFLQKAFNGSEFDQPPGIELSNRQFGIESVPVTHGFFEAARMRLLAGRLPSDAEMSTGAPVVVVSEATAQEFWPGQAAVGASLIRNKRPYTVVGVVENARIMSLDAEPQGEIFWPVAAAEHPYLQNLIVRFSGTETDQLAPVVAYVVTHCPTCWLYGAQMMHDALSTTIRGREFDGALFGAFGVSALVIVGAGILGIVSMATNRRTREVGIRMALGATRAAVMRQIVREQMAPVIAGLLAGGLVAAWATRFVESSLYKTPTYDPWAWSTAATALILIALLAAFIPSRQASQTDPVQALRVE
jgi:predicted permease